MHCSVWRKKTQSKLRAVTCLKTDRTIRDGNLHVYSGGDHPSSVVAAGTAAGR
jgi:hypothetical protein